MLMVRFRVRLYPRFAVRCSRRVPSAPLLCTCKVNVSTSMMQIRVLISGKHALALLARKAICEALANNYMALDSVTRPSTSRCRHHRCSDPATPATPWVTPYVLFSYPYGGVEDERLQARKTRFMDAGLVAVGIRRLNEVLEEDIDRRKKKENVSWAWRCCARRRRIPIPREP